MCRPVPLPPIATTIELRPIDDDPEIVADPGIASDLQTILGFGCVIEYVGEPRLITCRRYDVKGPVGYVGAICHAARGYRQFRTDRIDAVLDPVTGEVLGSGTFFARFEPLSRHAAPEYWGLKRRQKSTLVAGLNILVFLARCDGQWHPLEHEPIERFISSMWLRKEWEGDPPMDRILTHANRLAPGGNEALSAVKYYGRSTTSTRILSNAIAEIIAADGVILPEENAWATEICSALAEIADDDFREFTGV
jgi:hypothetical protein